MALLQSKYRTWIRNLPVDEAKVLRIELKSGAPPNTDPKGILFYDMNDSVVRVWVYDCNQDCLDEWEAIRQQAPHLIKC